MKRLLLFLSILCIIYYFCQPDDKKEKMVSKIQSDTVQAFNILFDSLFNKRENVNRLNNLFFIDNKLVIISKGEDYMKKIDTTIFKINIFTKEQICSHIQREQRKSRKVANYPLVLRVWYGKLFTDSTYGALFNTVSICSAINISGSFQEKPGGGFYKDSCSAWENDIGSFYEIEFVKRGGELKVFKDKFGQLK